MRYVLKDLSIDTETRTVRRDGASLKLPDLSFDVLVKLIEAAPEPVGIVDFSNEVWHTGHVSDETIAQRITLLRKTLGDDPKNPTYIRTVRGMGYAIAGSVTPHENELPSKTFWFLNRQRTLAATAGLLVLLFAAGMFSIARDPDMEFAAPTVDTNPKTEISTLVKRAREQLSLHQARETDRAIIMLRDALTQEPASFDARLTLSFALSTKATKFGGNAAVEQEAEAIARSLISERPDNSNAWSALAYSLSSQGRVDESLSAYQYAYQLNPHNTPAISSAAHTHLIRGELHQALLLEARAKQAGGTSRYAEVQIAQTLEFIGHPAAAKWYDRALSLNPSQVVILSEIARSHLRQGNPHAALQILGLAEGDDRSAPQILQLRGRATMTLGHVEEARFLLEAAGDGAYFDIIALNVASGDATQAEELLMSPKLAELGADTSADTRIHLAEITAALGQDEKALQFLARAINLGWRDLNWLKQSPYLGAVMSSNEGRQIENRITRELEAQRRLIEGAEELTSIIR